MPSTTRQVATAPAQDRYQRRLGSGLTPQSITAAQREADTGAMAAWADMLDEARQGDLHLHGDLAKRELALAGAPYEIRLPDGTPRRSGDRAIKLCSAVLGSFDVPAGTLALTWPGVLQHLASAMFHGRAAVEIVYARDGRYLVPRHAYPIHARRLSWSNISDWRLHVYDSTTYNGRLSQFPGVPCDDAALFPRGKLLLSTPRTFGTYPTREGLGRALVWYSAFKRWTVRDWLAFAEWAGRGLRVGKYATGRDPQRAARANDEDVDSLQQAIEAMSSTVSTIIPDVTDLEIIAPADNDVHHELVKLCNGEMSKAILGGTLTSDPGDRGARSLGEVHLRAMTQILRADAQHLAAVVRRDLFAPLVSMNLGSGTPVPEIVFDVDPPEDRRDRADRLALYMDRGLQVPASWLRGLEGVPEATGDEPVVGSPRAHAPVASA